MHEHVLDHGTSVGALKHERDLNNLAVLDICVILTKTVGVD